MIHDDLHFAISSYHPGQQVTIIDFDDCGAGWFAMDVAMALFDVLVSTTPDDIAARFLPDVLCANYLEGATEEDLSLFLQCQIPQFLKLKELCIYATLIGHPEISQPDTWVGRFMRARASRVAANIPYVDIDYINV
jgi:Ser/Thr protein kinase RdoA (MazF antagonist)